MRRFLLKILLLIAGSILICLVILKFSLHNVRLEFFPRNNLANSNCFRAQVDFAAEKDRLAAAGFIISGSSISLNNVSGSLIEKCFDQKVYNFSTWGTKPAETLNLLRKNVFPKNTKYLLIAFNDFDFGKSNYEIKYDEVKNFIYGSRFDRVWIYLNNFNINRLIEDWNYFSEFRMKANTYESLVFDESGSIMLDRNGFEINPRRWMQYRDTTGFSDFLNSVKEIKKECESRNIQFITTFLPWRKGLLPDSVIQENEIIAKILSDQLKNSFVDLSKLEMNDSVYCDGSHLFREGAEIVTKALCDSLISKGTIKP
jgi:hypothetical protein